MGTGSIPARFVRDLWFLSYRRAWLRADFVAGLTTAAVAIPQAMAYAAIAGLPVQFGLYVALVPMLVYAVLGTSPTLSVSCTSTIALLTAHQLEQHARSPEAMAAAAATLALLTGVFLLLARALRLGFVANFISDPVLTGFKSGIGLVIIASQVPKLLGVPVQATEFFREIQAIVTRVPSTSMATLALGIATFALLYGLHRWVPRAPAQLVAVALAIAAAAWLGLEQAGIALTGHIPPGIPAPSMPDLALARALWPGALGIALMSFAESIAAGRAFARPDDRQPSPNRELFALGAANVIGSFFHCFPAGGGTSQTAVNTGAGACTQAAAIVTAAVVVATLLFLSPLISLLPQATLAAIVIATTVSLLNPREFRAILALRRMEFYWAVAASAGVILLGTLPGIAVAVALSILTLLYQENHPLVYALARKPGTDVFRPISPRHPGDQKLPGLLIARTEGVMTFANIAAVGEQLEQLIDATAPRVLIFDCSAVPDIEYTALRRLIEYETRLRGRGIVLWLAALNPVALYVVQRSGLADTLGRSRMFFNVQDAVAAYQAQSAPK